MLNSIYEDKRIAMYPGIDIGFKNRWRTRRDWRREATHASNPTFVTYATLELEHGES